MSATASPIAEYIDQAPAKGQPHLRSIYAILKSVCPEALEAIKWRYPVFEENRILYSFAAFKDHLNFYPTQPALNLYRNELSGFKLGKGSLSIRYDQSLPEALIRKMAEYRLRDVRENDARWM